MELLHMYESLPETLESESIFEVAGYPHYENVCSNILAFYFNPHNEHGLGNLLLSSLMNLAGESEFHQKNVSVSRELTTIKGGRIDIVIETDNQLIGIENKINHILVNDLADYSDTLTELARYNELNVVKVIFSLRDETESCGFISITYEQFLRKVRERLGDYISTSSQKWLLYLIDFMNTIECLNGANMEIDKRDQFFIENEERVNALLNDRNKFYNKLTSKIKELLERVEQPAECARQWIYAKSCLVHDFHVSDNSVAFDLYITPSGWDLQLFGRNIASHSYLTKLFSAIPPNNYEIQIKDSRYVLKHYDLKSDLDEIINDLNFWFAWLIKADKEHQACS